MKFLHLADLHIGKRVNEYSMLEDQRYIFGKLLEIVEEEKPDGILLAGDIYDKTIPSAEAVELFDTLLVELSRRNIQTFVISGNHDSPERIAFGGRLMEKSGIHMSPVYDGCLTPVTLEDAYGPVHIWMLPFIKPAHVRRYYPESEIQSYTDAVRVALEQAELDSKERNILITHQFVVGAERTESEDVSVGGTDGVDVSLFDPFDYTALGHIHRPQNCKSEKVRYAGTPLKYSFSETKDCKSVTVVELYEKGTLQIRTIPLHPLRDMVELRGTYQELMSREFYQSTDYQEAYTHITLVDEEDIPDAVGKLRTVYHNLMKLDYDNRRTRSQVIIEGNQRVELSPYEIFAQFYELQNNQPMEKRQQDYMKELIERIWEGDYEAK